MSTSPTPTPAAADSATAPTFGSGFVDAINSAFSSPTSDPSMAQQIQAPELAAAPEPMASTPDPLDNALEPIDTSAEDSTEPTQNDPLDALDNVGKDWTTEAAHAFKQVKTRLKEVEPKYKETLSLLEQKEARIRELEALSSDPKLQELETRVQQYEKKIMIQDIESSSVYQEQIAQPLRDLGSVVETIAERYQIPAERLVEAVSMSDEVAQDEALSELLAGASDRDKARIYSVVDQLTPLMQHRAEILENAEAAAREVMELERERQQTTLIERAQQRQQAANMVAERISEKLPFISSFEGFDFKEVAKEVSQVDPTTLDAVNHTYNAIAAKLLPQLAKNFLGMQRERDSLVEKLAAFDKSRPRAGGPSGGSGAAAPMGNSSSGDLSFAQAVAAQLG